VSVGLQGNSPAFLKGNEMMTKADLELVRTELLRHATDSESWEIAMAIVDKALEDMK
jgi:hypothetical protein